MKRVILGLVAVLVGSGMMARGAAPVEFLVGEFPFERPEGWEWVVPSSAMRKAELAVPGEGGKAEVTFFHFGAGQGGTVEQNIARWVNQFDGGAATAGAMQKEETFGVTKVVFVTAAGTFQSGMPGGPTTPLTGYGLLGAILVSDAGDVYVKMTGPEPVVRGATAAFEAMVKTAAERIAN